MLNAFKDLGCNVDLVTGYSEDRSRAMADVKRKIRNGTRYDFVYSESSTMPTILTDAHHMPLRPFLDWRFFEYCKLNRIPIGLFYRDIYWLFDNYGENLNAMKVMAAKAAYNYDLFVYQRTLTRLYLPSLEMARYVPRIDQSVMSALPPGHAVQGRRESGASESALRPLRLFYVGGMSSHYRLHTLLRVVSKMPQVELTVCTREAEWEGVRDEYPFLTANIKVIHEIGARMEAHLRDCDIAVLFVQPHEYREFASPVKLYEYLGHHKPIVASEGTLSGRFVRENQVGWTIPYEANALANLLDDLCTNAPKVTRMRENTKAVSARHTWRSRAEQVIIDLVK